MDTDLHEPTPSKRLRSYDGYSSSPSFSEISCHEEKSSYSLRRKREPLTPIKTRLRQRASLDYATKDSLDSQTKIEKRLTRSSVVENSNLDEPKSTCPLIPLGSNLVVSISDSDSTKGISELPVHILIDHNLSIPTKTDIITPNFSIVTAVRENSLASEEDISDLSYLNRHKKKELFEKKTKNRAKEVYRHELHSKMLRQEQSLSNGGSLAQEKTLDTDASWYKNLIENKDQYLFRVGVFKGQELWGIDQDRLEELIKSKEIQSDYLPVNTPVETDAPIKQTESKRRSLRKKISK